MPNVIHKTTTPRAITLNCDLGEGDTQADAQIMPYINKANIACGGHAGNTNSMQHAIEQALIHHVDIGAHPSYPDKANFGRKSQNYAPKQLEQSLLEQIHRLDTLCKNMGAPLTHIKPHGALYNDAMQHPAIQTLLLSLIKQHYPTLPLVLQATNGDNPINVTLLNNAKKHNVTLLLEAFADRRYTDNGLLQARSHKGAVFHDTHSITEQANHIIQHQHVVSHTGKTLSIAAHTLCVHGDNPSALAAAKKIKALLT